MENFETYKLDQTGQQTQAILDQVSTNTADIAQLRALYEALTQSEPVIIQPSDTWPVADPQENVIYRVIDRVNTPPQSYSDYMWNGTAMVLMATYNNSIDNEPTPGSNNLVKSGGVAASIVFDISAYHATGSTLATYANLAAALGTDGANVPASVRKGGMSVKFVQSADNKYVQYRLMAQTFSTNKAYWQGVDNSLFGASDNLTTGSAVLSLFNHPFDIDGFLNYSGALIVPSDPQIWHSTDYIPVFPGLKYKILSHVNAYSCAALAFYDENKNFKSGIWGKEDDDYLKEESGEIPDGIYYIRACSYLNNEYYSKNSVCLVYANDGVADALYNCLVESYSKTLALRDSYTTLLDTFTEVGYLNSVGIFIEVSGSSWRTTEFVPVLPGLSYKVRANGNIACSAIVFYDKDKKFLSSVRGEGDPAQWYTKTGIIPKNCYYVRSCTQYMSGASFDVSIDFRAICDEINIHPVDAIENDYYIRHNSFTEDGFINTVGNFVEATDWKATDYIPVIAGLSYDVCVNISSGASIIAFYDKDKNFLSATYGSGSSGSMQKASGIIPKNCCFIRSCKYGSYDTDLCRIVPNFDLFYNHINSQELIKYGEYTEAGFINTAGNFVEAQNWKSTDYIPVFGGITTYDIYANANVSASLIAFYDENKKFIDKIAGTAQAQGWDTITGTIPLGCYYIRCCTYYPAQTICNLVTQKDDITNLLNGIKRNSPSVIGDYIDFTVPINQYVVDNSDTENQLIDDESDIVDVHCILKLPSTYSSAGLPSKLVMICHGAGTTDVTTYKTETNYNNLVNELVSHGYAIFDCSGYANNANGCNFWGAPKAVNAWRKAYDYVVNHYNVEKDVCIYGFSMGGLTAMSLALNHFPNVKCVALGSPVLDLYKCFTERNSQVVAGYGYSTWSKELYAGNNPMGCIFEQENMKCFNNHIPPLKIWYGGIETSGYGGMTFVEKEDAKTLVDAITNSNGTAFYREVEGAGHEICFGGNTNINKEIRMFFDRYSN